AARSWPVGSAHVHEVDDEDERLAALDRAAGATVAVAQVRRDGDLAPAADLHAEQALVPALDDLADTDREVERLTAVPRRVELLARGPGDADVVRGDLPTGGRLLALADLDVLDDELAGRGLAGEVDLGLGLVDLAER